MKRRDFIHVSSGEHSLLAVGCGILMNLPGVLGIIMMIFPHISQCSPGGIDGTQHPVFTATNEVGNFRSTNPKNKTVASVGSPGFSMILVLMIPCAMGNIFVHAGGYAIPQEDSPSAQSFPEFENHPLSFPGRSTNRLK